MRSAKRSAYGCIALKAPHIAGIGRRVRLRPLFAILIAIAMLFAPFVVQNGMAMAAPASDHHGQMMSKGHCDGESGEGKTDKAADKSCCAAMCTAIAVAPSSPEERLAFVRDIQRPTSVHFRHDYLAKLPTPPPRRA